jgi:hypothetical protein
LTEWKTLFEAWQDRFQWEWHLDASGAILCCDQDPLQTFAAAANTVPDFCGKVLAHTDCVAMTDAATNQPLHHPDLRRWLLATCKLEEVAK